MELTLAELAKQFVDAGLPKSFLLTQISDTLKYGAWNFEDHKYHPDSQGRWHMLPTALRHTRVLSMGQRHLSTLERKRLPQLSARLAEKLVDDPSLWREMSTVPEIFYIPSRLMRNFRPRFDTVLSPFQEWPNGERFFDNYYTLQVEDGKVVYYVGQGATKFRIPMQSRVHILTHIGLCNLTAVLNDLLVRKVIVPRIRDTLTRIICSIPVKPGQRMTTTFNEFFKHFPKDCCQPIRLHTRTLPGSSLRCVGASSCLQLLLPSTEKQQRIIVVLQNTIKSIQNDEKKRLVTAYIDRRKSAQRAIRRNIRLLKIKKRETAERHKTQKNRAQIKLDKLRKKYEKQLRACRQIDAKHLKDDAKIQEQENTLLHMHAGTLLPGVCKEFNEIFRDKTINIKNDHPFTNPSGITPRLVEILLDTTVLDLD